MVPLSADTLRTIPPNYTTWVRADVIASTAAVIAVFAVLFNLYASYLNKQLEIKFLKFDNLVISTLDQLFEPLNNVFLQTPRNPVSVYLTNITEALVDIELFLIQFKDYYTTLEIDKLIKKKEEFSDHLYNNPSFLVKDAKVDYLAFKTRMFFELYDFARKNEIGHFNRLKMKFLKFHSNHTIIAVVFYIIIFLFLIIYFNY